MRRHKVTTRKEAIALSTFIGILCLIIGVLGLSFFVMMLMGNNPVVSIIFIGGFALFIGCYCFGMGVNLFYKMVKNLKSNNTDYDNWI